MGKSLVFISILGMIFIMLHLFLPSEAFGSSLLTFLMNPYAITSAIIFTALLTALSSVGAGIVVGTYLGQNWIQVILAAAVAGFLFNYTMEMINIIIWFQSTSSGLFTQIFCMVLALLYLLGAWSIIEWVLGKVDA